MALTIDITKLRPFVMREGKRYDLHITLGAARRAELLSGGTPFDDLLGEAAKGRYSAVACVFAAAFGPQALPFDPMEEAFARDAELALHAVNILLRLDWLPEEDDQKKEEAALLSGVGSTLSD